MKTIFILNFLFIFTCFGKELTLSDIYQMALSKSEALKIQKLDGDQLEEKVSAAKSEIYPNLSLDGSYGKREDRGTSLDNPQSLSLSMVMPIFKGFKEYSALRQLKYEKSELRSGLEQLKLDIYFQVLEYVYGYVAIIKEKNNEEEYLKLTEKRVQEIKDRSNIGKASKSDFLEAKAKQSSVNANLSFIEGKKAIALENLSFLTGEGPVPQMPIITADYEIPPLEKFHERIKNLPKVNEWENKILKAQEVIEFNKGGHYPTLDLEGDYYLHQQDPSSSADWQVLLKLKFPLYEGGKTNSQIASAVIEKAKMQIALEREISKIKNQINILYSNIISGKKRLNDYGETLNYSEKSYLEKTKDYRLGLSTNLDVFNALDVYMQNKKQRDFIQTELDLNIKLINAISGVIN